MATRSYIGYQQRKGGPVKYIYCHNDGYPKHVGKILYNHYRDVQSVTELIGLGDISQLGPTTSEEDTISYHRWRGERIDIGTARNEDDYIEECRRQSDIEYAYLMSENNMWYIFSRKNSNNWIELKDIIEGTYKGEEQEEDIDEEDIYEDDENALADIIRLAGIKKP